MEKDGNYALNTLKDVWKYDPMRLLDLGNDFQVLMSSNKPKVDEEARARSNFQKLVEDEPRPISHTAVDATRLIPDLFTLAGGIKGVAKGIGKVFSKSATEKASKDIAKKLVSKKTSDVAEAFSKSKFLPRDKQKVVGKKWVENLLENKDAMEIAAGNKKLSDEEVRAIRKNIKKFIPDEIAKHNAGIDELKDIWKRLDIKEEFETKDDLVRYLNKNKKSLGLTDTEYGKLLENISVLPDAKIRHQHLPADRVLDTFTKENANVLENLKSGMQYIGPKALKVVKRGAAEAVGNDLRKTFYDTNNRLEIKPNYYSTGSEPTPITDTIASIFNVDFDDPARFNKKDIDTFFEFLEKRGIIEPGIKDKWTPRQKVSVMRELSKNKNLDYIKDDWAESEYKKSLDEYYKNKGE